eukprot:13621742-Alexandrium_andersonii.AAC.1
MAVNPLPDVLADGDNEKTPEELVANNVRVQHVGVNPHSDNDDEPTDDEQGGDILPVEDNVEL